MARTTIETAAATSRCDSTANCAPSSDAAPTQQQRQQAQQHAHATSTNLDGTPVTAASSRTTTTNKNSTSSTSALNDLATVTEMLDFLEHHRLESVHVDLSDDSNNADDADSNNAASNATTATAQAVASTKNNNSTSTYTRLRATAKKKRTRAPSALERDRKFAKRVYYQTLDDLESLRSTVTELERTASNTRAAARTQLPTASTLITTSNNQKRQQFAALLDTIDALRSQNAALVTQLGAADACAKQLQQLTTADQRATIRLEREWTLRSALPPAPTDLQPLTAAYCAHVTQRAYRRVLELTTRSVGDYTWGAELFGWKDHRRIEGSCLTYSLEKIFLFQSHESMAQRYWDLTTREDASEQLYSPSLNVRFHILQHVDENNVLIYRTIDRPAERSCNDVEQRMRTFVLTSRVALGDNRGWIILTCAVDPARVLLHRTAGGTSTKSGRVKHEPVREELWMDNFKWLVCEPMGESAQHSKLVFGGVLDSVATANPSQWILEELMVGIRYERGGRGPFSILCD